MAKLNEDVLRLIFDYLETPLEWIQVSEVCQLWKSAASKHWRKVNDIYYESGYSSKYEVEISAKDAKRIVKCAAPFVKTLTTSMDSLSPTIFPRNQSIKFGPFSYKVLDFNHEATLEVLADNATNITEVNFEVPPEPELFQRLIDRNNIKKFKFERLYNFYEHVSTDDIEELEVTLDYPEIRSFMGHFPNLRKLELVLEFNLSSTNPEQMLSPILPHVLGVTSLTLDFWPFCSESNLSISCKNLMDISKLLQLEDLSISFHDENIIKKSRNVTAVHSFTKKLTKNCQKLRSVDFRGMEVTDEQVRTLLTLPHLENLFICKVTSFRSIELPEMLDLTRLTVGFDSAKFDLAKFCSVLRKLPKLEYLSLEADRATEYERSNWYYNYDEISKIVCQVLLVAVSQNKDLLVSNRLLLSFKGCKIERKNTESLDTATQTLNLVIAVDYTETVLKDTESFVQNNLDGYHVIKLKGNEMWKRMKFFGFPGRTIII